MSVTSGFFNSLNGDRRYNAEQMSAIFNGIIRDGIFASVGKAFTVESDTGNTIKVSEGRAWFNSTWVNNDASLYLPAELSEVLLNRYDAVVLEIDHTESVRAASIKIIKGTPASTPQYPTMAHTTHLHQYPLAYIYRKANSTEITQADITSMIGTSSAPYVTGILEVQNIDNIVAQWMAQWDQWTNAREAEFNTWFANIKNTLGDDAAAALANRILNIENGTTPAQKAVADGLGRVIADTYAPKSHGHKVADISDFPTQMNPTSHSHPASHISAGTLAGKVIANASAAAYQGDSQVRNIHAGTTDIGAGASLASGAIYLVYE